MESNRIIHHEGEELNVTELAAQLSEEQFKTVKIKGEAYSLCYLEVWMQKAGDVKLVVADEADGFHFYVSNRLDWSVRQVLEAYKVRQSIDVFYRDAKQNWGWRSIK